MRVDLCASCLGPRVGCQRVGLSASCPVTMMYKCAPNVQMAAVMKKNAISQIFYEIRHGPRQPITFNNFYNPVSS